MDAPEKNYSPRAFWGGLIFWISLCFLAVVLRGVRWEEGYERAQVLLNITPYPEGHPNLRWFWNAFSIHYYLSAAALWLTDSALLVCGGRQFIATIAIHVPIYLLTWVLTRRAAAAHMATLLGFVGANTFFQSYMPISPWATKATSGIIGMGWAFAVLIALSASRWRWAGILFGLMPLVHLGQWPMILLTTLATMGWLVYTRDFTALRRLVTWASVGFCCCVIFAVAQQSVVVPDPTEGAYYSAKDGQAIWATYTTNEDMHRALTDWPRFGRLGNSNIALIAVLLIAWPLALREVTRKTVRGPWRILVTYALLSIAAVWFARLVHQFTGTDVPYVVVSWMPYRLIIHVSMLLLCVAGARACLREGNVTIAALASLAWLAALPLWSLLLPEALANRYFSATETALFLLTGGMLPALWNEFSEFRRCRTVWGVGLAAGILGLALYHQVAAATVLAGLALGIADNRFRITIRLPRHLGTALALLLGLVSLGNVLGQEWTHREHLPISPFEAELAAYLAENSAPDAMVLTPLEEHYQMVLNRPVVATFETRQFMSYMQSLSTTIEKLFGDLYGVTDDHWYDWELWQERSTEEWQELGKAYGFRYVLSKTFYPLHLPECKRGDGLVLYEIPQN